MIKTLPRILVTLLLGSIGLSACYHEADNRPDRAGDTVSDALVVAPGDSVNEAINSGIDIDVFSITLPTSNTLSVHTEGDRDTVGELFFIDPDFGIESLIDARDDIDVSAGNFNFQVAGEDLPAGTYYVRVVPFPGSDLGPYTLVTTLGSIPNLDGDTVGDSIATATPITPGTPVSSELNNGLDIDMFRVTCVAVCNITASTSGFTDTVGRLLDDTGAQIDFNDDSNFPVNLNFQVSGNGLPAGDYFIEVTGFGGVTTGPYSLLVTVN